MSQNKLGKESGNQTGTAQRVQMTLTWLASLLILIGGLGCKSASTQGYEDFGLKYAESGRLTNGVPGLTPEPKSDVIVLHEGDAVRITFPGAPNLNTVQTIRRDGRISLPIVGELRASGLTPPEMEKKLLDLYGPQLQSKEVNVAVESSAFIVYVTGAVVRPGKILTDRPINTLEAIMEAGGCDYNRANLKAVRIIRNDAGKTQHFTVNLKGVLAGQEQETFTLKPGDIVYVPERFSWF